MKTSIYWVFFTQLACMFLPSSQVPLSPDKKKLYHHITSGKGLYSPHDKIIVLNATDFKRTVFNKEDSNAWIIEFYNSWCGHCLRFAPSWKSFAWDISGWKKVINVGAVDCSNNLNTPLCRDYEVMFYPMIKFFPAKSSDTFIGKRIPQGTVDQLREDLVKALLENTTTLDVKPFYGSRVNEIWMDVENDVKYILAVSEDEKSTLGMQLGLDLLDTPLVRVRSVRNDDRPSFGKADSIVVVGRDMRMEPLVVKSWGREGIYQAVSAHLNSKGFVVKSLEKRVESDTVEGDVKEMAELMQMEERIKAKLNLEELSDTVFQLDIERALKNTLAHEIPSKKNIEGESLVALKNYLEAVASHFPFGEKGLRFLKYIKEAVETKSEISGEEFEKIVKLGEEKHYPVFLEPSGWVGCRGSRPNLRGFPCGLWLMFHSLTVNGAPKTGTSVLYAILGYVKHFFGCTDCSEHFQEMASTIESSVFGAEDSVLWLWEAHNAANKRLSGDPRTEDPRHPKVQFPPASLCPSCYSHNGTFSRPHVLLFLRSMFHNISYLMLDDLPQSSSQQNSSANNVMHHTLIADQSYFTSDVSKPFIFNIFDLSLCVILYICCISVVLGVSVKFFLRKSYRRKVYVYDLFQKV